MRRACVESNAFLGGHQGPSVYERRTDGSVLLGTLLNLFFLISLQYVLAERLLFKPLLPDYSVLLKPPSCFGVF